MGVYIKGMEMPNKKNGAVLIIYPDGKCAFEDGKTYQAVPVPPHGRLIDADGLAEHKFVCIPKVTINGKDAGSAYRLGWNSAIEAIMENAETIIGGE